MATVQPGASRPAARTRPRPSAGLRRLAAAVGIGMLAALLPTAVASASAGPSAPAPRWQACGYAAGYQCASVPVPLDYDHPGGPTIRIAVIRHLATDPARRADSLFFNPGGPGGPGTIVLPLMYDHFPAQIRERFDIVSFDPRGVGRSDGLKCFPTQNAEDQLLGQAASGFPVGASQVAAWNRTYRAFDAQCAQHGGAVLGHMSTGNAARDMDVLRRALGQRLLNYWGVSYGSILGSTYANLFPRRVGAMVLDGNIDPVAWTQDSGLSTALRMGSDQGSAATLKYFLQLCGRVPASSCAFSAGTPAATSAKYGTLLRRLLRHPVTAGSPAQTYTYASTVSLVDDFLNTVVAEPAIFQLGWKPGAQLLQDLWQASGDGDRFAGQIPGIAPPAGGAAASAEPYNGAEQELAVWCQDSPNPRNPLVYDTQGQAAARRTGGFGPMYSYRSEPCSAWPAGGQGKYAGPWNRPTASPILVIGNTSDPATPYSDSVALSRDLARGRLLTVRGYGHTELLNTSSCATRYTTRYLLTGALPPAGTVCKQDGQPFRQ